MMNHKTMVEGTLHSVKGGRVQVDGTVYRVERGRVQVDGTVYAVNFGGMALTETAYDQRNGADITVRHNEQEIYGQVRYGTGKNYAGVYWQLTEGGEPVLLQAGDTVRFSFSGSHSQVSSTYGAILYTDEADPMGSAIQKVLKEDCSNWVWTVRQPCMFAFVIRIGGIVNNAMYASLTVTDFAVNGQRVWVED